MARSVGAADCGCLSLFQLPTASAMFLLPSARHSRRRLDSASTRTRRPHIFSLLSFFLPVNGRCEHGVSTVTKPPVPLYTCTRHANHRRRRPATCRRRSSPLPPSSGQRCLRTLPSTRMAGCIWFDSPEPAETPTAPPKPASPAPAAARRASPTRSSGYRPTARQGRRRRQRGVNLSYSTKKLSRRQRSVPVERERRVRR